MSFTRAIEVAPGEPITSRQQRSLARALNDRLRFATDFPWRVAWMLYNSARLVRNPADGLGLVFPSEGEFWSFYSHFPLAEWPEAGPGEPEGANLGAVLPQFIFGNPQLPDEAERLSALFPMRIAGQPPQSDRDLWILGALQRGAITADGSAQYVPAFEAAQTVFRFAFHPLLWHGKSYGGWQPQPEQDSTTPWCGPPGNAFENWPNRILFWTALSADVSTAGLHGTISTVGGRPRVTYAGSCPCGAPNSAAGHVIYVADLPFAWYLYIWDGTYDSAGNCRVYVDRLDKSEWVEGPYDGAPAPRHRPYPHLLLNVWQYIAEFRGADSQRTPDTFSIEKIAADTQRLWMRQYPLAPAYGVRVGNELQAVYPTCQWERGSNGAEQPLIGEAGPWAPHPGFVIAGFLASATGLREPVGVTWFADGRAVASVTLTPDDSGRASKLVWLPDGIKPRRLTAKLSAYPALDRGGIIQAEAAEIQEYRAQSWDQYLVTRFATANGARDPQGPEYDRAARIVRDLYARGCISGEYPAPIGDQITDSPLYHAWRRLSRLIRVIGRQQLLSYELDHLGTARLRFRRRLPGYPLDQADPWEGIAPPPHSIASGELIEGETYLVRGTNGGVQYQGRLYGPGQTFTAGADAEWTQIGDCAPWVEDGIRHAALKRGWTNEWVMLLQTHVYDADEASLWKPSIYADFFTFGAPEHFSSPSSGALREFINATYSFAIPETTGETTLYPPSIQTTFVNPEAPSAYTYSSGANSSADTRFRRSRQLYPKPYELRRCTLEFDAAGEQIVVLELTTPLRRHENAPASVPANPLTWSSDDLARLAGTHPTSPEDYRTDDNAIREYLRYVRGDGAHATLKIGDTGYGGSPYPVPHGNVFPWFILVKLVPEAYEDANDRLDPHDTRVLAETYTHAAVVLDAICEGFVAGSSSAERTCRNPNDAGLYDYTRETLFFEAFADRSIAPFPESIRPDRPIGFGPLPNTVIYADVHNRLARAVNLLTRLRLDIPLRWEYRILEYQGARSVTPDSLSGSCDSSTFQAWIDAQTPPPATTLIADSGWIESFTPPSFLALYGTDLTCCPNTSNWCLVSFRRDTQWRVTIAPGWEDAVSPHVRDLVAIAPIGSVAQRVEERVRHRRIDEYPRTQCSGVNTPWKWKQDRLLDNVVTCEAVKAGTLTAPMPPAGDFGAFKPLPSSDPCFFSSEHSIVLALLAFPGAYVEVPLADLTE
jgi:hypothetical protein